jgi:predicted dehydrogenase
MVAQWMHVPFLTSLPGYTVTAVCDASPRVAASVAQRFQVADHYTEVDRMLAAPDLDAVLIATPIHGDIAVAAARAGKHVLVEKPMALSLQEADAMVDAAEKAGVILMVAYMKRYDPGYVYGQGLMRDLKDVRLIRAHDLCGPNASFLNDLTTTARDPETETRLGPALKATVRARSEEALGAGHPEAIYRAYDLLGGLGSHDIAILRGAFGSPVRVLDTQVWQDGRYILSTLDYGAGRRGVFEIGLTAKKDFDEELVAFDEQSTVRVRFPSPFIKYAPTLVEVTAQEGSALVQRTITASYQESFQRELEHFRDCIVSHVRPTTDGREGIEDVRLQIDIMRAALA